MKCEAQQELRLDKVVLSSDDDAVHASGECRLVIADSEITGGDYALRADGRAQVEVVNSILSGRRGAVQATGAAVVSGRGSEFRGGIKASGAARFRDLGENTVK